MTDKKTAESSTARRLSPLQTFFGTATGKIRSLGSAFALASPAGRLAAGASYLANAFSRVRKAPSAAPVAKTKSRDPLTAAIESLQGWLKLG